MSADWVSIFKQTFGETVLSEKGSLGCLVVGQKALRQVASFCFFDARVQGVLLETIVCKSLPSGFELLYKVFSIRFGKSVWLKTTIADIEAVSVVEIWPFAAVLEKEIEELFGLKFDAKEKINDLFFKDKEPPLLKGNCSAGDEILK